VPPIDPLAPVAGLVVGILVGLTGVGSGSLMAPLLILVFGRSPLTAVGTDLAYSAVTKIVGSAQHLRFGTVDRRLTLHLARGSVPAALLGVGATYLVERESIQVANAVTGRLLGLVLLFVTLVVLLEPLIGHRLRARQDMSGAGASMYGAITGALVGLTSLGTGALLAPILILRTRLPYRSIVGTDIAHAAILTTVAATAHLTVGHVDGWLVVSLLIGSIPGIIVGSRVGARIPASIFRFVLGCVLLIVGIRLVL
jgi:uncharacterized protein